MKRNGKQKEFDAVQMMRKIRDQIDVVDGLENAPDALRRLFTGRNLGKQLVRIAEAPIR